MKSVFANLFSQTLDLFSKTNGKLISKNWDVLGLLISVNLIKLIQAQVHDSELYQALKSFWIDIEKQCWNQIKVILEWHLSSLENANVKKLTSKKLEINAITLRYSELASGLIFLSNCLAFTTLQRDMIKSWFRSSFKRFNNFLQKAAEITFPKNTVKTYVYRITNIFALKTIMEAVGGSDLNGPSLYEVVYINEIFSNSIKVYAQQILEPQIGYLFQFVHANENTKTEFVTGMVKEKLKEINIKFKGEWLMLLKSIKASVIEVFQEDSLSSAVIGGVYDYFLSYVHRLHRIVDIIGDKTLVPVPSLHQLVLEIKRIRNE